MPITTSLQWTMAVTQYDVQSVKEQLTPSMQNCTDRRTIKFRSDFLWSASLIWYFYEVSQQEVEIAKLAATDVRTVTSSSVITSTISYGKTRIAVEADTTEPFPGSTSIHRSCDSVWQILLLFAGNAYHHYMSAGIGLYSAYSNVCRWLSAIEH